MTRIKTSCARAALKPPALSLMRCHACARRARSSLCHNYSLRAVSSSAKIKMKIICIIWREKGVVSLFGMLRRTALRARGARRCARAARRARVKARCARCWRCALCIWRYSPLFNNSFVKGKLKPQHKTRFGAGAARLFALFGVSVTSLKKKNAQRARAAARAALP